jgi:hypothetical protein
MGRATSLQVLDLLSPEESRPDSQDPLKLRFTPENSYLSCRVLLYREAIPMPDHHRMFSAELRLSRLTGSACCVDAA